MASADPITPAEYRALGEFRYQLRRFLSFSDDVARAHGLEPAQHQLLLAIRAATFDEEPTIGDLAERLILRHHSVVGLVNRLEHRGLVERRRGEPDRRQVHVRLTARGENALRDLTLDHRAELETAGPRLLRALEPLLAPAAREEE